jgi:hypothetical protein
VDSAVHLPPPVDDGRDFARIRLQLILVILRAVVRDGPTERRIVRSRQASAEIICTCLRTLPMFAFGPFVVFTCDSVPPVMRHQLELSIFLCDSICPYCMDVLPLLVAADRIVVIADVYPNRVADRLYLRIKDLRCGAPLLLRAWWTSGRMRGRSKLDRTVMTTPVAAIFSGKIAAASGLKLRRSLLQGAGADALQRNQQLSAGDAGVDSEGMLHSGSQGVILLDLVPVKKVVTMPLVADDLLQCVYPTMLVVFDAHGGATMNCGTRLASPPSTSLISFSSLRSRHL